MICSLCRNSRQRKRLHRRGRHCVFPCQNYSLLCQRRPILFHQRHRHRLWIPIRGSQDRRNRIRRRPGLPIIRTVLYRTGQVGSRFFIRTRWRQKRNAISRRHRRRSRHFGAEAFGEGKILKKNRRRESPHAAAPAAERWIAAVRRSDRLICKQGGSEADAWHPLSAVVNALPVFR